LHEIDNLVVRYPAAGGRGVVHAVEGVSLDVAAGEVLGIVGESGCGKSTFARALMGIVQPVSGAIRFDGRDLLALSAAELRRARLDYQMVFQDPFASLNPGMTVGEIILEALTARAPVKRAERGAAVAAALEAVGLNADCAIRYPHEFSGGQRQRIAIARALAPNPRLLIADEAVSALDVSVQSQILNLLMELRRERNLTMLFISHDLSVVRHISDRIAVMYLGRVVESGPAGEVLGSPLHMYTKALLSASPVADPVVQRARTRLILRGDPPSPANPPPGCAFAWRSPKEVPPEVASQPGVFRKVSPTRSVEIHPATVEDSEALNRAADALT
jgi:oligopeptide/dipeptide ABC transporter ATP-binding protein